MTATFDLPLFPLSTVLFPGAPLSLRIFEDRYKQMVAYCLQTREPFGVVLIKEGVEALGPLPKPHTIGCTAQIAEVHPLDEGQMNILAVGQERFRILSLRHDQPYLVGTVELYPLNVVEPRRLSQADRRLRPWVERYMQTLARAGDVQFDAGQLPADPLGLAYLAAALLQIPLAQKQALLASEHAAVLLDDLRAFYRRETVLLDAMIAQGNREPEGPFSLN